MSRWTQICLMNWSINRSPLFLDSLQIYLHHQIYMILCNLQYGINDRIFEYHLGIHQFWTYGYFVHTYGTGTPVLRYSVGAKLFVLVLFWLASYVVCQCAAGLVLSSIIQVSYRVWVSHVCLHNVSSSGLRAHVQYVTIGTRTRTTSTNFLLQRK